MSKKFRSKWFRVAVEGATTDGRKIERTWIEQMAASYNRTTYGARIWMEHLRSTWHDGAFKAYGDVLAVKAEEITLDGEKRMALFAQIEPTDALVDIVNVQKQKIYTSIEINEKFADTGAAYLVGLAVTDTPASLGTEALQFAAQLPSNPLSARKQSADNLFTAAEPAALEFEEVEEPESKVASLFKRVSDLLSKNKEKTVKDDAQFADLIEAVEALAGHAGDQAKAFATEQTERKALEAKTSALTGEFADLLKRLGNTQDHNQQQRPLATGGDQGSQVKTDC
jgi:hypothetical protein